MGMQIIRQPNDKFAVFSSVVDGLVAYGGTEDEIAEFFIEEEADRIRQEVKRICAELRGNGKPYYQFTITWDEALAEHERRHGPLRHYEEGNERSAVFP